MSEERTELEKTVDQEPIVPKKKRPYNRKVKPVVAPVIIEPIEKREWYCATCRETFSDNKVMKLGAGDNGRFAIFCPDCQKFLNYVDEVVQKTIKNWIQNNPTK